MIPLLSIHCPCKCTYYVNLTVIDNATSADYLFTAYVDQAAPAINSLSATGVAAGGATLSVNASDAYSGISNCTTAEPEAEARIEQWLICCRLERIYTASLSGLSASTPYTVIVTCYDNVAYSASSNTSFTTASGSQVMAIDLGTAGNFVILAETTITLTGTTAITGDVGISPNGGSSLTGFAQVMDPSGTFSTSSKVTGSIYAADYAARPHPS